MDAKLKSELAEQLEKMNASDLLDVILELHPQAEPPAAEPASRSELIAARKDAFNQSVGPIEEEVRKLGGEVTGRAWINQTVRARVPAEGVKELSKHEKVAALDLPHPIAPETA